MQIGTDNPIDLCLCRIEDINFPNQELIDALKLLKQILDKYTYLFNYTLIYFSIIDHPGEEKYQKLNKTNAKLIDKLFKFNGIVPFLLALGFEEVIDTNISVFNIIHEID